MKFYVNHIVVWLNDEIKRSLHFKPNKINRVVHEDCFEKKYLSEIIHFCLFNTKIPFPKKEVASEKIACCAIQFVINDKQYTIARYTNQKQYRHRYFFSDMGEIPSKMPQNNINEERLKTILEKEFSIEKELIFNFEGKFIQKNTQSSLQDFLIFNFLKKNNNLINHRLFADKQKNQLDRHHIAFDIAVGLTNFKNIEIQHQIENLAKQKLTLEKRQMILEKERSLFQTELEHIIQQAKHYQWIPPDLFDLSAALQLLENLVYHKTDFPVVFEGETKQDLLNQKADLILQLNALKTSHISYREYRNTIKKGNSDLKITKKLKLLKDEKNKAFDLIIEHVENEFAAMKSAIMQNQYQPMEVRLGNEMKKIEESIANIDLKMKLSGDNVSEKKYSIEEKYIFLGEVKAKLEIFRKEWDRDKYHKEMKAIELQMAEIGKEQDNFKLTRTQVASRLTDIIVKYLGELDGDYQKIQIKFDTDLFRIDTDFQEENNRDLKNVFFYRDLNLSFYLSLHELLIKQKNTYNPSFLVAEQLEDNTKYTGKHIEVLSRYIDHLNLVLEHDFQIIITNEAATDSFEDFDTEYVWLVQSSSSILT